MFDLSKINPNHKFLLINGPARSGKDTLAAILANRPQTEGRILHFAKALKDATHAAYGLFNIAYDFFEAKKDSPLPEFFGLTPRQAYIAHSEDYFKKLHGQGVGAYTGSG